MSLLQNRPTGRHEAYAVTISSASWSSVLQFRVSKPVAHLLLGALGFLVLVLIVAAVALGGLVGKASESTRLEAENLTLRRQLGRLAEVEERLAVLDSTRKAMLRVVGVDEAESPQTGEIPQEQHGDTPGGAYRPVEPGANPVLEDCEIIARLLPGLPVRGPRTREFGPVSESGIFHKGIDIAGQTGAAIRAAGEGIVTFVGCDEVFGNVLVIAHDPRLATMYGHASRILVKVGDFVTAGQAVAEVGSTGRSTAPHLHFEVQWDGRAIDPGTVFAARGPLESPGARGTANIGDDEAVATE